MAREKKQVINHLDPPKSLNEIGFFRRLNFSFSEEQVAFRDAIYNKNTQIVFCNAKSGTGKTTVAVATACAMVELGLYDGIVYIFAPIGYQNIGLLPGTVEEKTAPFVEPLYQALTECGYFPDKYIKQLVKDQSMSSGAFVDCVPHTFMRGINFDNKIIIIDESQNFYTDELKKVLTRVKDSCKIIVIGHDKQCDLYKNPSNSGFVKYLDWFKSEPYCEICELTTNYRGVVSTKADELEIK